MYRSLLRSVVSFSKKKVGPNPTLVYLQSRLTYDSLVATEVEGIFRLSGSTKRIKDLQIIFNSPDRYGKGLDWTGFTVHDAANILRRYLNQLPEPIIPLEFYRRFRDPLVQYMNQVGGQPNGQAQDGEVLDEAKIIEVYQQVITELPPLNRQLLLYILDLLAVFASKSDVNRMTSTNLAAIFQPGMLSHPQHDMEPGEYRLSQDVLVFLIENQDHFLIGMRGTAADDETVRDVQAGGTPPAAAPATPSSLQGKSKGALGRSSSNASRDNDSVKRFSGGVRRNVSVSSKHSGGGPSPGSPGLSRSGTGGGVHRSNTVPSKKSPGLTSNRFFRPSEPPTPPPTNVQFLAPIASNEEASPVAASPEAYSQVSIHAQDHTVSMPSPDEAMTTEPPQIAVDSRPVHDTNPPASEPELSQLASTTTTTTTTTSITAGAGGERTSRESLVMDMPSPHLSPAGRSSSPAGAAAATATTPPTKERNFSSLFSRSPTSDGERRADGRAPNKLRKKRIPGANNESAQSSTHSLNES